MIKIDVHQHLWTEPLLQALAARDEMPFVREDNGLQVLFLAGERPYAIDTSAETPTRRAALLRLDELDEALVCLSSPLGIESLAREEAIPLIDAYHKGAISPLLRMGAYFVEDDGVLARRPMSPAEELRPLAGVADAATAAT